MRAATLGLLLVILAPVPSVGAVSDDALLHLRPISTDLRAQSEDTYQYQVGVHVQATDDATEGTIHARLELQVSPYEGGTVQTFERDLAVEYAGFGRYTTDYSNTSYAAFDLPLSPGIYLVSVNLTTPDGSSTWDHDVATMTAGENPDLASGWGAKVQETASMDLDDDGADDVVLRRSGSDEPEPWRIEARTHTGIQTWENRCSRGLYFSFDNGGNPATDARISSSSIRRVLGLADQALQVSTKELASEPLLVHGEYRFQLPARASDSYLYPGIGFEYAMKMDEPFRDGSAWSDGFRTYVNVTQWDLDADLEPDVRFYDGTEENATAARAQTPEERRAHAMTLYAMVRIEHRATRRIMTFDFERVDGQHGPAWVEIAHAGRLFRRLMDDYAGSHNTTIRYEFELPGHEAFVQDYDNRTWVWIGHFSTQTLRVVLEYRTPAVSEGPVPRHGITPAPGAWVALVVLALVAAMRRRC